MQKLVCLLVGLCFLTGCEIPVVKSPIGTPWKTHEASKLNGGWVLNGEDNLFKFVSQKDGRGVAGSIDVVLPEKGSSRESDLQLVKIECVFTRIGEREFLFLKQIVDPNQAKPAEEDSDPDGYIFAWITKRDANQLTLAIPTEKFTEIVDAGKLPGTIIKKGRSKYPIIDTDEKTFIAAIDEAGVDKCFDTKHLATLDRIGVKTKAK